MDQDEQSRAGVARGQNVLYVLPEDAAAVSQVVGPVLERLDPDAPGTQLLVLTADPDTAMAVAKAATRAPCATPVRVLPVTGVRRAARLLRTRPAVAVAGTPADVLELIRASALKLDSVRVLVLAWVDAILDSAAAEALEAVIAEVPRDSIRVVSTSRLSPDVEAIVERYARRPRRVGSGADETVPPTDIRVVTVSHATRPAALRRLLDDLDPDVAAIFARSEEGAHRVTELIRDLGYTEEGTAVHVTRGEPVAGATLLVLYELPIAAAELRTLVGNEASSPPVVALAQPRQLGALRTLAAGGDVSALTLSGPAALARQQVEGARDEIRHVLRDGAPAREVLTLEPLLADFDAIEVAAALLRLLEQERERPEPVREPSAWEPTSTQAAPSARAAAPSARAQVFINAGARDNIGPRELVGALANEVGIAAANIGKIDVRENHSIVEIAPQSVQAAIDGLTGITMRGRQLVARLAQERSPRDRQERSPRERGEWTRPAGPARGPARRGERPGRPAPRDRERPRGRGERPERGDRRARGRDDTPPPRPR